MLLILVFGLSLASAFTAEQQMTIEGMNLSYQLGSAHEKAIQGHNVTEFNNLVDTYNAWIRQHFAGEGAINLLMSKIIATNLKPEQQLPGIVQTQNPQVLAGSTISMKTFNTSSDLSKFGRQRVRSPLTSPGFMDELENAVVMQKMKNL